MILDEPINGLDPSGIVEFRQLLKRLNEEKNITILLSSHILTELQQLATVYGFLSKGRLLEQITAETLHERLNEEKKITILLSSHILTELQQLATVYGFLSKGRLLEQITAETLHERCTDSVEITVSDVQQYAVFLEEQLSGEGYKVLPDGKIRIVNPPA